MARSHKNSPTSIRDGVVETYVKRLTITGLKRADFEVVMADLAADKAAGKPEVLAIASSYLGVALKPRAKKATLEMIRKKFVEQVRFNKKQELA
jgi:hypothetical protein